MRKYYLAIDIGLSYGRHMLGTIEDDGKISVEEIYHFSNQTDENGAYRGWNLKYLFGEIIVGMKECKRVHKIPYSVGIDGWSAEFVLLNEKDKVIAYSVDLPDLKLEKGKELLFSRVSEEEFCKKSGLVTRKVIPIMQLLALKEYSKKTLEEANSFLLVPDYFHFLLTGEKAMEYTNAVTTGLIDTTKKELNSELIRKLGLPEYIFKEIRYPETYLANLTHEVKELVGFDAKVILPSTNSLISTIIATPTKQDNFIVLQSDIWSCLGAEYHERYLGNKICSTEFSNITGYESNCFFHKPVVGLWVLHCIRMEYGKQHTYEELLELAKGATGISSLIDIEKPVFQIPLYVAKSIQEECSMTKQEIPVNVGEVMKVAIQSLAMSYCEAIQAIEEWMDTTYPCLYILGEGIGSQYLNEQIAMMTKKKLYIGPECASAIGNIIVQMLYSGEFLTLTKARKCVKRSFLIRKMK